jgi:signal transduction histidine kinase
MPELNFNPFSFIILVTALVCYVITGLTLFFGKVKSHRLWAIFNLTIAVWASFVVFATTTDDPARSFFLWKFSHSIGIFIAVLFFHFASTYCDRPHPHMIKLAYLYGLAYSIPNLLGYQYQGVEYLFNSMYYLIAHKERFLILLSFWLYLAIAGNYMFYLSYKKNTARKTEFLVLLTISSLGYLGGISSFLPMLGVNLYPITIIFLPLHLFLETFAILRNRFIGIQIILEKGLVYSIFITLITFIYLLFVYITERFLQDSLGYNSLLASITIVLIIAFLVNPLKNRIQYFVDRLLFKGTQAEIAEENERLREQIILSEKLKAVATLASGMAHEIKNPLTAIYTFCEYLPEKLDEKEFLQRFSKLVLNEVERINELVHSLLEFSRPSPPAIQRTNIHKLLDEMLDFLSSKTLQKKIEVYKRYQVHDPYLDVDPNQFRQAVLNIILNAVDVMDKGGILIVSTELRESPNGQVFELGIKDSGPGIPEENLPHIFDPFFSTKSHGTGLGLSVTKSIVQKHKGTIKAYNDVPSGVKFVMEFPFEKKED